MKLSGVLSSRRSGSRHLPGLLMVTLLVLLWCSGLAAQPPQSQQIVESSAEGVSQREALERVRASFPGNIISINEVIQDGRLRFRIRMDNEGNIYTVYVDQATGVVTRE